MKLSRNISPCRRRTGRGFRPLLIAAATFAVSLSAAAPSQAAQTGVVPDLTWGTSSHVQSETAAAMDDLNAQWARINISWQWVENKAKGDYDPWVWNHYDRAIELARAAGSKILIMVDQSPQWASGSTNKNMYPRDPADYADFMRTIASRYRGQVEAYEVWNEENLRRFWPTGPNPAAYGRLLKAAYPAVKQGDPNAEVLFGGTARNDYAYLEGAYAAHPDLGQYFDIMAVHPYSGPYAERPPEEYWYGSDGRISKNAFIAFEEVRKTMLARGDDKPIWATEFGWATTSTREGVTQQQQADYLRRGYDCFAKYPYVQVATWYNLRNNYWANDADTWEDQLGLFTTDFSRKPAYDAFKTHVADPAACIPRLRPTSTAAAEPPAEPTPTDPAGGDTEEQPQEDEVAVVSSSVIVGLANRMRLRRAVRVPMTLANARRLAINLVLSARQAKRLGLNRGERVRVGRVRKDVEGRTNVRPRVTLTRKFRRKVRRSGRAQKLNIGIFVRGLDGDLTRNRRQLKLIP